MAVPTSPEQWLPVLGKRLDDRQSRLATLHRYVSGDAPLPEGATSVRSAFEKWQELARTDFPNLIVDAPAERMTIAGFRVGTDNTDNDAARQLWERSEMDAASTDVHRDALIYGFSYGMAQATPEGAVLTRESPFECIADHDPLLPGVIRAMMKTWTDSTDKTEHAVVHVPGYVQHFSRPSLEHRPLVSMGGWEPDAAPSPTGLPAVPGVRFLNRDGRGEFELHTNLLDRINWITLQRLLIIAMQAFRQRAVIGALPTHDANGNKIDWGAVFTPGPDALWTVPEGVTIWESSPGDVQQILQASKTDVEQLSAVTRTPLPTMMPGGENQTAEGAAFAREGLVYKVEDRRKRFTPKWNQLVGIGLALDGVSDRVSVQWAPAERQTLAEKYDALAKATDVPWRWRMEDILGYGANEVDLMEVARVSDALNAMLAAPATTAPQQPANGAV